ncbi:CRISPR-associated protein Csn2-St [Enterococcus faecalis]|uniref:CRISPR-associated protein Csn2-St n=1 Tax=Enterococcus faecalis TaxID=1351 RepID=UPI0025AF679C|nr:CRISPR-associated protein Csn2-St [Enterococcus faecalis]MDN3080425.1 CRISPR-associated protein Csn2-St [Enterococcus faecalis]
MKQIRLEYQYQQFIEFSLEDYVFFYGGENQWRRKILRTLKRFAKQKALSDLEESVYGDNGIEIFLEEKKLKAKSIDFYFLEDNTSIFQQMNFIKGTLLHQELLYLQDDFDITNQMSNLNDQLLKLENLMNDKLNNYLTNIEPHFLEMNFQDILKYSLSLNYLENGQSLPLEMMDTRELLAEFIYLLQRSISRREQPVWLVITNPESFLETESIYYLFQQLKKLAQETKQLKFFIFSNRSLPLPYTEEDVEKTILLYDKYQQLPVFDVFRQSIERHYPDQLSWTNQQLIDAFYRVCHFVGDQYTKNYLLPKDIILLKLLKELLDDNSECVETSMEKLTVLEEQYFRERLLRKE